MAVVQITHDIELVSNNGAIQPKKCNQIIFRNSGDVDATINGIPLYAGDVMLDFAHNFPGEVLVNNFELIFKPGTLGVNKLVSVIRKYSDLVAPSQECKFKRQ